MQVEEIEYCKLNFYQSLAQFQRDDLLVEILWLLNGSMVMMNYCRRINKEVKSLLLIMVF